MLTIMLVASCLVVGSTTVEAADISDYPYRYYAYDSRAGIYYAVVSDYGYPDSKITTTASSNVLDPNTGSIFSPGAHEYYQQYSNHRTYFLTYTDFGWQVSLPLIELSWYGQPTTYLFFPADSGFDVSTIPPDGMPELVVDSMDEILRELDDKLNGTTETTTIANQIQIDISNSYTQYQNGGITQAEMQQAIDSAISQLNDLNSNSGNTLADLMAIQNALTYAQTVQDELLLRPSTTIITNVQNVLQSVTTLVQQYQAGTVPQGQAMQELRGYVYQLSQLLSGNPSVSDVEAINTGINTINNFIDVISNATELDKNVSDKSQQSDADEIDYINDLQSETTKTVDDLAVSKTLDSSSVSESKNIFSLVWKNSAVKMFLPIAACFMVISVLLGVKYKL